MERRKFIRQVAAGMVVIPMGPRYLINLPGQLSKIRLGGPVYGKFSSPQAWAEAHQKEGFSAAYCPLSPTAGDDEVRAYMEAAAKSGIVIAEVGAWSNPISPDSEAAGKAIEKCIASLELADRIGARCCVNISGSRNPVHWAGPHPENLTADTFDLIAETTRKIIDAVNPRRSFFTLEAMPWSYPDSADSYLKLIKAIDRRSFGVHIDPVNWITSPQVYYSNGDMIRDAFRKLGPYIKSCHAKDIVIREDVYVPSFEEVKPGLGYLDYPVFLSELASMGDVPLMMEHLGSQEEYASAAAYIKNKAKQTGIDVR